MTLNVKMEKIMAKIIKKKILHKKCGNPKCKHAKNWIHAPACEMCGWDFALQRLPRKRQQATDAELDALLDAEVDNLINNLVIQAPLPPNKAKKACPNCAHMCYHAAVICESCEFNFETNQKKEITKEEQEDFENKRVSLGVRPVFSRIPHHEWMNFDGKDLKTWATNFNRELRQMFQGEHLFSESILAYAEVKMEKHLPTLTEMFMVVKYGVSEWHPHPTNRLLEIGEMLTQNEQLETNRRLQTFCSIMS